MKDEDIKVLPESVHDWDEVKTSETPEIFWDRIKNLRSKMGNSLHQPGEGAGDEALSKFDLKAVELSRGRLIVKPDLDKEDQVEGLYRSLGKPEKASGYEFEEIEGSLNSDDRKKFMSDMAHASNLTKAQLRSIDKALRTAEVTSLEGGKSEFDDAMNDLKQDWGFTYNDRLGQAKKVVSAFFPQLSAEANLSAAEIKAFYSIAKQLGGGGSEFANQGDKDNTNITPAEAEEKIGEIRNNKDHPYNNPLSSGYQAARKKVRHLYQIKTGEAKQ